MLNFILTLNYLSRITLLYQFQYRVKSKKHVSYCELVWIWVFPGSSGHGLMTCQSFCQSPVLSYLQLLEPAKWTSSTVMGGWAAWLCYVPLVLFFHSQHWHTWWWPPSDRLRTYTHIHTPILYVQYVQDQAARKQWITERHLVFLVSDE